MEEERMDPMEGNSAIPEQGATRPGASTTERVAAKAHETIDRATHAAKQAEQNVRATAAQAAERAKRSEEQVEAQVREGVDRIRSYVEHNPLASAGIAFVAGVLLSSLIRR